MEPETPDPNVKYVAGYVEVSKQLTETASYDYDRLIMGELARTYGLAVDAETAALLDAANWRPQPFKPTLRQRLQQELKPRRLRGRLALWIAPWLDSDPWDD